MILWHHVKLEKKKVHTLSYVYDVISVYAD